MAQNTQEWARKLQQTISQRSRGGGGGPKLPGVGGIAGIALLLGGGWAVNNALFNGIITVPHHGSVNTDGCQWMVVIELSNTLG